MRRHEVTWHMRPSLRDLVEDAYDIFGGYRVRRSLSVCHCNSCMSEENERLLLETPLREIPADLLAEYTASAHNWDDGPVAREMRYFLPRYLELIAEDDPPDTCGLDICLRRLGYSGWRAKWPERECALIDRFFDELMLQSLERTDLVEWPVGWRLAFDISDVLTLVVTAHGDLPRVLATWDGAPDPFAALHMAALREKVIRESHRTYFHSPYLEDRPQAADRIGAFLARPELTQRIETAFFQLDDPRLQKLVSDAIHLS
jgi:hypothetical protein